MSNSKGMQRWVVTGKRSFGVDLRGKTCTIWRLKNKGIESSGQFSPKSTRLIYVLVKCVEFSSFLGHLRSRVIIFIVHHGTCLKSEFSITMCTSLLINTHNSRKSFTILADDDASMNDRFDSKDIDNLPAISNKIKSIYHQNCVIPNEDFSILYNSIASKLQPPSQQITIFNKNLYSPSKEFFNKVSSKLRDLRPKVTPKEEESAKMERPMFITTVKSGTFLEPPPEVAALLGLRKNSFNSNTNSSNSSTAKTQNNDRMYSFASKPRILKSNLQTNFASRSLFRVETRREKRETLNEPLPKIP